MLRFFAAILRMRSQAREKVAVAEQLLMGTSYGMAFDQRGCLCCDDPGKREITRREKRPEIRFCAFAATDHQHEHIRKTSRTSSGVN